MKSPTVYELLAVLAQVFSVVKVLSVITFPSVSKFATTTHY